MLLLLTCLRLYGLAVSMFGDKWGRGGIQEPWFKKKEKKEEEKVNTVYHVTYVTVDCNSLLELIKSNVMFQP